MCHDLPAFPIPDNNMARRWQRYMRGDDPGTFTFKLCISIPVESRYAAEAENQPVAVVNVNIQSEEPWPRALSRSWRDLLDRFVEPWTALLWAALGPALAVDFCVGGTDSQLLLPLRVPDVGDLVAKTQEMSIVDPDGREEE